MDERPVDFEKRFAAQLTVHYQGKIIYKSSVSEGTNLALFNPSDAEANTLKRYVVSTVSVGIEEK